MPPFAPLPKPNAAIARPEAWKPDGRPTLVLFTASWCPSCPASILTDIAIANEYRDRYRVGVGLVENTDRDFLSSPMAHLFAGIPVWNADSIQDLAVRCRAAAIPMACLVDRGRVIYHGPAVSARHVLDEYSRANEAVVVEEAANHARAVAWLATGVTSDRFDEFVAATHNDPGWQHAIALQLAQRRPASATDLVLAVQLGRAAVAAGGGLDYIHLDTYNLALSKAGHAEDADKVSWRVLAVCITSHGECLTERTRAYGFIYYWRETHGHPRH